MKQILIVERLFDGEAFHQNMAVTIEAGKITAVTAAANVVDTDPNIVNHLAGTLVPGFVDVQVNGGGGALFNDLPSVECIETIGRAHARFGTTGFLPTLITDDVSVMAKAADAVAEAIKHNKAGVLGVHFEGPHLSVPKKGVHPQLNKEKHKTILTREESLAKLNDAVYVVEGANLVRNEYGTKLFANFFFFITGFHGFHVFSGVVINFIIFLNVILGTYEKRKSYEMVEKVGLYWHFVDLVWVFVFTFFYLV